jgi:hypothetical protein
MVHLQLNYEIVEGGADYYMQLLEVSLVSSLCTP